MQTSDLVDTQRGALFLLCTKDTPADLMKSWRHKTIGVKGEKLDYRLDEPTGHIEVGYKETLVQQAEGVERRKYFLEKRRYLHGEPGLEKKGKLVPKALMMSLAYLLGASEIHIEKIEDKSYAEYLEGQGVKVVVIEKEVSEPVEVKTEPFNADPAPKKAVGFMDKFRKPKKKKKR